LLAQVSRPFALWYDVFTHPEKEAAVSDVVDFQRIRKARVIKRARTEIDEIRQQIEADREPGDDSHYCVGLPSLYFAMLEAERVEV
jgi:hypothetical protein